MDTLTRCKYCEDVILEGDYCNNCYKEIAARTLSQQGDVAIIDWVAARRETTKLRRNLKDLVTACEQVILALDGEMKKPSDHERGKRVAKITNFLEMQKDAAKHFGLGKPLRLKKRSAATAR